MKTKIIMGFAFTLRLTAQPIVWAADMNCSYSSSVPSGKIPMCNGKAVTCIGTGEYDSIVGTTGNNVIYAGNGNDEVFAGEGDDVVCGGNGDDMLDGSNGNIEGRGSKATLNSLSSWERVGVRVIECRFTSEWLYSTLLGGNGDDYLSGSRRSGDKDVLIGNYSPPPLKKVD